MPASKRVSRTRRAATLKKPAIKKAKDEAIVEGKTKKKPSRLAKSKSKAKRRTRTT